jgi:hypothetical protein
MGLQEFQKLPFGLVVALGLVHDSGLCYDSTVFQCRANQTPIVGRHSCERNLK